MKSLRNTFFIVLSVVCQHAIHAQPIEGNVVESKKGMIQTIQFHADGELDQPRILELLGVREGDFFSLFLLEQGLKRMSDSARYKRVGGNFDFETGTLSLELEVLNRISSIDLKVIQSDALSKEEYDFLKTDIQSILHVSPGDSITLGLTEEMRARILVRLTDRGFENPNVIISQEEISSGGTDRRLSVLISLGKRKYYQTIRIKGFSKQDLEEFYAHLRKVGNFSSISANYVMPFKEQFTNAPNSEIVFPFLLPQDQLGINFALDAWRKDSREKGYFDFKLKTTNSEGISEWRLELERGNRYRIEFLGNVEFWQHFLRTKLTDKTIKLGVPFNMTEGSQQLRYLYLEKGYRNVDVWGELKISPDEKIIAYHIKEGPQRVLGEVIFDGISDLDQSNVGTVRSRWRSLFFSPFHKIYFDDAVFRSRIKDLADLLKSEGYVYARILETRAQEQKIASRELDLVFSLQLGPRYFVNSIEVEGNFLLGESELNKLIDVESGQPADRVKIDKISEQIKEHYNRFGFVDSKVQVEEIRDRDSVSKDFTIDYVIHIESGPQVMVGRAIVEGLHDTKDKVVLRELNSDTVVSGGPWDPAKVKLLEQQLQGLGIFSSVKVNPGSSKVLHRSDGVKDLVELQEKDLKIFALEGPGGSVEFGPGYRSDRGLIGFSEFNYRNLGGWNRSVLLRATISRKLNDYSFVEQTYAAVYMEPFLADDPVKLRISSSYEKLDKKIYIQHRQIDGYSSEEASAGLGLERSFGPHFKVVPNLYTLSKPRIFEVVGGTQNEVYRIATTGISTIYDTRNNPFNPTKGGIVNTGLDYSSRYLGSASNAQFLIFKQDFTQFFDLSGQSTFAYSLRYRRLWALEGTYNVPQSRRLSLGGLNSVRALREILFSESGIADQQSFDMRTEYRQPILADLGLALFYDAGFLDAIRVKSTGWRAGVGSGLRYSTPVGPVSLDYAINMAVRPQEDQYRVLFSIGTFQ